MHFRSLAALMRAVPAAALAISVLTVGARSQADQAMPNPPEFPSENPLLPGQAELGKFLFWEEQISSDNTMSCGTCHIHEAGGSDPRAFSANSVNPGPDALFGTADDIRGSMGVVHHDNSSNYVAGDAFFPQVRVTGRKAPSSINAVYHNSIFWDGRALTEYTDPQSGLIEISNLGALESQASGPPTSDVEMSRAGESWDAICDKLVNVKPGVLMTDLPQEMADFRALHPTYPQMFTAVYGDPAITSRRIMFAIGNYERTLISDNSPVDEFLKGQVSQLAPDLQVGLLLFQGKAKCTSCHVLPFSMDNDFHNIGVRPDAEDVGRMTVTGDPNDLAKFKTPNIRNAALRLPLFHNGSMDTVEELVDFYDMGGLFVGPHTDVNLLPLGLTAQEKTDLVHFINVAFTDPRVPANEFPFTRPTLHSELPSSNVQFGVASANGAAVLPELITNVPANQGHPTWKVGVHKATASAPALLALAFGPGNGSPFPDPRFPIPMNINVGTLLGLFPAATDVSGVATVQVGIPLNSALAGFTFYGQYFIVDAAALATGGVYGSKGVAVTIL
jgi:cytochrome c peroxidase